MKTKDLMIGDWVCCNGHNEQVVEITKTALVTDKWAYDYGNGIKPIPLTTEILEKNGFGRDDTDTTYVWFTIDKIGTDENYEIIIKWCDSYDNGAADAFNRVSWKEHWTLHAMCNRKSIDIEPTECIYVHELQHILKLLDIDKEIEL